jgi:hypothetical protein
MLSLEISIIMIHHHDPSFLESSVSVTVSDFTSPLICV